MIPAYLSSSSDAYDWAAAFVRAQAMTESDIREWFEMAIKAGYQEGHRDGYNAREDDLD